MVLPYLLLHLFQFLLFSLKAVSELFLEVLMDFPHLLNTILKYFFYLIFFHKVLQLIQPLWQVWDQVYFIDVVDVYFVLIL